jgi:hypothetical protein
MSCRSAAVFGATNTRDDGLSGAHELGELGVGDLGAVNREGADAHPPRRAFLAAERIGAHLEGATGKRHLAGGLGGTGRRRHLRRAAHALAAGGEDRRDQQQDRPAEGAPGGSSEHGVSSHGG